MFFFEKKNQKTFPALRDAWATTAALLRRQHRRAGPACGELLEPPGDGPMMAFEQPIEGDRGQVAGDQRDR
jgi:hypothetical protein